MRRFFGERGEAGRLERDLRLSKPEPRADFVLALTKHVAGSTRPRRRSASRLAFALALTTFVVGSFASFGGLSYAASGATSAADVVKSAVTSHNPRPNSRTSAQQVHQPPAGPESNAAGGAAAAPASQVAGSNLPFTGISLLVTAVLGLALLGSGLILRRAEKQRN
jgi:hypothetical protein